MIFTEEQRAIIDLMINNEKKISGLYHNFAKKFPEYKKFWDDMALEELSHAKWLESIYHIKGASNFINKDNFPLDTIKKFSSYVEDYIEWAKSNESFLHNAFAVAIDIENFFIEKKYFDLLDSGNDELASVLYSVKNSSERHFKILKETFEKFKNKN